MSNHFWGIFACLLVQAGGLMAEPKEVFERYRIGLVGSGAQPMIWLAVQAGAQDAARALEGRYPIAVVLEPATLGNPPDQRQALQSLFLGGFRGAILQSGDQPGVAEEVKFLARQNIPVVTVGPPLEGSESLATVVTPPERLGTVAGNLAATHRQGGRRGNAVAILADDAERAAAPSTLNAALAALREDQVPVLGVYPSGGGLGPALEQLTQVVQGDHREGRLGAWLLMDTWPLLGGKTLPWQRGRYGCVAMGLHPAVLTYLESGWVDAAVAPDAYRWGYLAVEVLVEHLWKQEQPDSKILVVEPLILLPEMVPDYRAKWARWIR